MSVLSSFAAIRTFVFDIDGVLTNSDVTISSDGSLVRTLNIKDVYAVQLALSLGYQVWIISAGNAPALHQALISFGLQQVHTNVPNKEQALIDLARHTDTPFSTMLYMGDDIPDLAAMRHCHIAACPADAATDVRALATYISPISGGKGCVRDVIEKALRLQAQWPQPPAPVTHGSV
jgi:3-deoxy-D-manno-octulosonate 8-phosphate phosphatase (KDO 8-P phosphatase)